MATSRRDRSVVPMAPVTVNRLDKDRERPVNLAEVISFSLSAPSRAIGCVTP